MGRGKGASYMKTGSGFLGLDEEGGVLDTMVDMDRGRSDLGDSLRRVLESIVVDFVVWCW